MSDVITTDLAATIDRHLDAYSEPDAARRDPLVAEVWAEDGVLVDPPIDGAGWAGISAMADAVQAHYPGHRFQRTSGIDAHHGFARYAWDLVGPDGAVAIGGVDVVELTDDGLIRRIVGFMGPIPPLDA
jgi:hypothetical protein